MPQVTTSVESADFPFSALTLASEVGRLSNDDLSQLEDDLDFYAFTNIASPLMKRLMPVLCASPGRESTRETNTIPRQAPAPRVIPERIFECRPMAIAV